MHIINARLRNREGLHDLHLNTAGSPASPHKPPPP